MPVCCWVHTSTYKVRSIGSTTTVALNPRWCNGRMGASSQGGRAAQGCYRKECSLTRRDETRGTAQHRTGTKRRANTCLSGVLNISTRQGMHHRRTGQAFTHPSTHPITHTIRPVSTEKHLRIPSQRYARWNTLLGREKCHLTNLRH